MDDFAPIIRQYKELFQRANESDINDMYNIAKCLYDALIQQYDYCEEHKDVKQQYRICQLIDEEVLSKLANAVVRTKSNRIANNIMDLHKRYMALSARRILRNFALYMEQEKGKKVWDKTMDTVKSVFYYADMFSISKKLNLLRASLMPSMGKSYIANLFVAQSVGNDPNIKLLRITYSDDLCISTTQQTESIINSKEFREIFPRYAKYPGKSIFKRNNATKYMFCLVDNQDEYNFNAVTREGQSTGKRADIVIIDDLLKDESESYNKTLHKKMIDRYESTWTARADNDEQKVMLLGTMWADTDLLNVLYDRAVAESTLEPSPLFKYSELTTDGTSVFIGVPALDEKDESTCPLRYSTHSLHKKRLHTSEFIWKAVYQQDPIAPDGLEFSHACLDTYEKAPTNEEAESRYAALDPARKGKNYVSMPISYRIGDKHFIVDWLYQKKGMQELYDKIVDKIIFHRLQELILENNTDTSLKTVLEERLFAKGYRSCTIIEKYSTKNKEQRIKDNQSSIRNNIVFPKKGSVIPTSDMGVAMDGVTSYSFNYPNKFDDGIDSLAMYAERYINKIQEMPRVGTFMRGSL